MYLGLHLHPAREDYLQRGQHQDLQDPRVRSPELRGCAGDGLQACVRVKRHKTEQLQGMVILEKSIK